MGAGADANMGADDGVTAAGTAGCGDLAIGAGTGAVTGAGAIAGLGTGAVSGVSRPSRPPCTAVTAEPTNWLEIWLATATTATGVSHDDLKSARASLLAEPPGFVSVTDEGDRVVVKLHRLVSDAGQCHGLQGLARRDVTEGFQTLNSCNICMWYDSQGGSLRGSPLPGVKRLPMAVLVLPTMPAVLMAACTVS